jgi:hypothetical protein
MPARLSTCSLCKPCRSAEAAVILTKHVGDATSLCCITLLDNVQSLVTVNNHSVLLFNAVQLSVR